MGWLRSQSARELSMATEKDSECPEELNYTTSPEVNLAIAQALAEIGFIARVERLMPHIAKALADMGVDFSKAKLPEVQS